MCEFVSSAARTVFPLAFKVMSFNNEKIKFQIDCASRGYHIYRSIWSPKLGPDLLVKQEVGNVHDPFAIGADIPRKLTSFDIMRHIPREINRLCHYFVNYGGAIEAKVRETKYRPSPIPSGGLEIPILLIIKKRREFIRSVWKDGDKSKWNVYRTWQNKTHQQWRWHS